MVGGMVSATLRKKRISCGRRDRFLHHWAYRVVGGMVSASLGISCSRRGDLCFIA